MDVKKYFGSKIREFRNAKCWSQEVLAQKTGLHRTYIWIVERWEKNISLENIEKIAKALEINIKDIF